MSDKTEEPTPRKLEEARSRGQTGHSFELNAAVGLIGAALLLQRAGKMLTSSFSSIMTDSIRSLSRTEITISWIKQFLFNNLAGIVMPLAVFIFGMMAIGIAATVVQTGFYTGTVIIGAISLVPGMQFIPFFLVAAILGGLAFYIWRSENRPVETVFEVPKISRPAIPTKCRSGYKEV